MSLHSVVDSEETRRRTVLTIPLIMLRMEVEVEVEVVLGHPSTGVQQDAPTRAEIIQEEKAVEGGQVRVVTGMAQTLILGHVVDLDTNG
jgi:hypothetical protein